MNYLTSKILRSIVLSIILTNVSHASGKISDLFQDYEYAMTVEWDQKDAQFSAQAEEKLLAGIEAQIRNGSKAEDLAREALGLIQDEKLRINIDQSLKLYSAGQLTSQEVMNILEVNRTHMSAQGSSWSMLAKIGVGVVVAYAGLKVLQLIVMNWDTDPDYGNGDEPPKTF